MASNGFGDWYAQQQQPPVSSGFSINGLFGGSSAEEKKTDGDVEQGNGDEQAPLFGGAENFNFTNLRAGLEAQLPQKIMGMNYQQRFQVFCGMLILAALFFALAFFVGLPMITVRPQKFALSFTFGSLLFMSSFGILKGPWAHFSGMIALERLPFTSVYIGSMFLTLYLTFNAGGASGYVLVLGASACQLLALMWYLITFLPGGAAGMRVLTQAMYTLLKPIIKGCAKVQAMCLAKCFGWATGS